MQTIQLPAHFPGDLDLEEVNRRLHAGEIDLDWSLVAPEVDPAHLRTLLAGLSVSEHIELLGTSTIGTDMQKVILTILNEQPPTEPVATQTARQSMMQMPEIWRPFLVPQSVTALTEVEQEEVVEVEESQPTQKLLAVARPSLLTVPAPAALRDELAALVVNDLLGPAGGPEETVAEARLSERYLVGLLAPTNSQISPEEQEGAGTVEEGSEEQGPLDSDSSQTSSLSPSTIGLSFSVGLAATSLVLTARWGDYQRVTLETPDHQQSRVWQRTPCGGQSQPIPLKPGTIEIWHPEAEAKPHIYVKGMIRRRETCWMVTLFLVNGQPKPRQLREQAYLFQPELSVAAPDGAAIFQSRPLANERIHKTEDRAMSMLYRQQVSFAVGHSVSVHAEISADPTCATRLTTTFVPHYDVPLTQAPTVAEVPALANLCLDMQTLALTEMADLASALRPLVTAYAAWITTQEGRLPDPNERLDGYGEVATQSIAHCRQTLARIDAGIDLLTSNADAARAFAFTNRAMWLQRIHTLYAEQKRRGGSRTLAEMDLPANRSWRPFQLAFILLNLPALTDLHHADRGEGKAAIADLLWFPTGGGKTEAYLGLTAYTLAIRRLQGTIEGRSGHDGVAVLMRYTLRLLTLQQFQRAASLICACESIRRTASQIWGSTPFRLGLWVGQHSTPNTTEASQAAIDAARNSRGSFGGSGSPRQLTNCPWCGTAIEAGKHLTVEKERGRTLIYCGDAFGQCAFSQRQSPGEGLPVVVVDEEIYRLLPALLIATVDKFAQLPWKGETQMLFGQVDTFCPRHGFRSPEIDDNDIHRASKSGLPAVVSLPHAPLRPLDLIIQDELHLISGPLGTLVGLYETAVDTLATWTVAGRAVRPKVIAATATIRQADVQIERLFMRDVSIFPPQGIDVSDNFFARQREPSMEHPGRRYLGICAHGKRLKAAQIRVYVAYLAAAQTLYEKYGAAADPWMTLVGYFNSMNQLGGMRRLVDDEIKSRVWRMDQRGLVRRGSMAVEELTSRKGSADIPEVLNRLELGFDPANDPKKLRPIDILLATNMISVGVDVRRLGLMVVTGQPKTTAEYIQATSRVGRAFPGLVCVVYNWARPRDLSHYEQFEHYHATFYKHVEALSVTPFASRALDRGLAALLTSIVRLASSDWNKNINAGLLTATSPAFDAAIDAIIYRATETTTDGDLPGRLRDELESLKEHWVREAVKNKSLGYKVQRNGLTLGLLKEPQRGQWEPFTCLNSLRDVEPTVHLILDENGLDTPFEQTTTEGEHV